MAKVLTYPESPETPKFLLSLALKNGIQSIAQLFLLSTIGGWVVGLLSTYVQTFIHNIWLAETVNLIAIILIIAFVLVGVVKCNALYSEEKVSNGQAASKLRSQLLSIVAIICVYVIALLAITWIGGLLQLVFKQGSMTLGATRVILGFAYLFFLVATFLILPFRVMSKKSITTLLGELLGVCTKHWLRCFLCLFCWLIAIDCLAGNLAFILVPALGKIAYSVFIVKTVIAFIVLPILISYTTLLTHDISLRTQ